MAMTFSPTETKVSEAEKLTALSTAGQLPNCCPVLEPPPSLKDTLSHLSALGRPCLAVQKVLGDLQYLKLHNSERKVLVN
jgi:hypothetical protein